MPPYYWQQLLRQIIDIGYFSLPVVGLTTLFSGMVLALQSYTGFARFSAEDTVATVVVLSGFMWWDVEGCPGYCR